MKDARQSDLFGGGDVETSSKSKLVKGGNVPGGHHVLWDGLKRPFIPPTREMDSVPLRHSDVVVDIGAYCGLYAIRCARFPVARVVAYEPTPGTFEVLSRTTLPNLESINAAIVGDDSRHVDLFVSEGIGVTNSVVKSLRKAGSVRVNAVNYLEAIAGASVVKIDVEGAEYDYPILQPGVRAYLIDFHPMPGDWIGRAEAIIDELEAAGFTGVITPDFSCGWTQAGSWVRDVDETGDEFEPMMSGRVCCGCGVAISGCGKALCPGCFSTWSPKHRATFDEA